MLTTVQESFLNEIKSVVPFDRIYTNNIRTLAYGTDASFYKLTPAAVIKVENEIEVSHIIKKANLLNVPVTFRAAGTSLSGQAITDSILVLLGDSWKKISVSDDLSTVTMQPGIIGGNANRFLSQFKKKIGPDPASINSAKIGGIIANNASGMSSGIKFNSYNTISEVRLIFNDGTILDTSDSASVSIFLETKKEMVSKILELRKRILKDSDSLDKITTKYQIKNTTGYGINSLVDFDDPVEIIKHLIVGSEGTLAFLSEVTLQTIDDYPDKATALAIFPNISTACRAISPLRECYVNAAELMDRASLKSIENKPGLPGYLKGLPNNATALLIETKAPSRDILRVQINQIIEALKPFNLVVPIEFTIKANEINTLWGVRKGLFPSICVERKEGTTVIIEDITVPYPVLDKALIGLQELFVKYEYYDAIIWGHAFDGNVHFVLNQDFGIPAEKKRYQGFIDELVQLIAIDFGGSLKGEHGTGRNMAPFVKFEWGETIAGYMKEIKDIFDAKGILNPGVLISDDPQLHLKNLKPMPVSHPLIDKCIECGFCEPACVSRDLTLSPRQRISVFREISSLKKSNSEPHLLSQLIKDYAYDAKDTCAADGLCELSCPVSINTGNLIKALRVEDSGKMGNKIAMMIAKNYASVLSIMRFALNVVYFKRSILGKSVMNWGMNLIRTISGGRTPIWLDSLPKGGKSIHSLNTESAEPAKTVVYFPSCINRSMGASRQFSDMRSLPEVTESLLKKAGYTIVFPKNLDNLCCGMPFLSKGYKEAGILKVKQLEDELLRCSNNGLYPVLCDMSPCLYTMKTNYSNSVLDLYEPAEFTLKFLKEFLDFNPVENKITVYPVCSTRKMGQDENLYELAKLCSNNVFIPEVEHCCGFAGDKGFNAPELNHIGLRDLSVQLKGKDLEGYATSRSCELGLTDNTGVTFQSILYLVDQCTTPKVSND